MDYSANQQPRSPSETTSRPGDEMWLLDALRSGDEGAFLSLVTMHYAAMLRLAQMYVGTRAVAEEVIQETWLGVLQGLSRFEGRSSLKTWIFRILLNRARTRAQREQRTIPFSALVTGGEPNKPAVEPDAFRPPEDQYPGGWLTPPAAWDGLPEERLLSQETRQHIEGALTTLPPAQREVITLRDIDGWSSGEVCEYLGISEANQRVLLHRARSRVRRALASYLAE
ncbi:MAG TPA: RNA polymerase sigma factor [Ktedonobacterales bacterium]